MYVTGQSGVTDRLEFGLCQALITRKSEQSPHPYTTNCFSTSGDGGGGYALGYMGFCGQSYNQRGTKLVDSVTVGMGWVFGLSFCFFES